MPTEKLIMAIAATAELCGKVYSPAAARMLAQDLDGYDEDGVMAALTRCRKELDGKPFNVAAIIARIEDGHPGVEEAWAMMPVDESQSVVWTLQMAEAFGAAQPLLDAGDRIGARMTFKEAYTKLLVLARDAKQPAKFTPSLGTDVGGREVAIKQAVDKGRLSIAHAQTIAPMLEFAGAPQTMQQLGAPKRTPGAKPDLKALLLTLKPKTMPPPEARDYDFS
jgi:hypothetical protein